MSSQMQIPTGKVLLNRMINSQGQPVDGKETLAGAQYTTYAQVSASPQWTPMLLETGIKPVDLLAPLPYGGVVSLSGGYGVGKMVLMEEIAYNLATRHNTYLIAVTMHETSFESSYMSEAIIETKQQARSVVIFEKQTEDANIHRQMVQTALTIAEQFRQTGNDVLLVFDEPIAHVLPAAEAKEIHQFAHAHNITTLLIHGVQDTTQEVDGQIVLNQELAQRHRYPAVDRQRSQSTLLLNTVTSEEHQQIARQVRELLQQSSIPAAHTGTEQQRVKRAHYLDNFLTQPFFVTEEFTGQPGEYLTVAETLQGCRGILAGTYDNLSEDAFLFIGTIDQAVAKHRASHKE